MVPPPLPCPLAVLPAVEMRPRTDTFCHGPVPVPLIGPLSIVDVAV